ncbi:MAG TPA: phosphatase PAP2 family protein [Polyangiaceae bacterium]
MLHSIDICILQALYVGEVSPLWLYAIVAVSFLGSGWMLLGLLPALLVRTIRLPAAIAIAALTLTSGAVASVKVLTARVRPCNALGWAHALPIALPSDCSFPSGHAAGSFALAFFVLTLHRRAGAILVALATLIALSRVALGVHYPSDVLAGALLGSIFGWAAARIYRARAPAAPLVRPVTASEES